MLCQPRNHWKVEKWNSSIDAVVTRFAPSPTGYLHLGHVVNAIYVWGIAGARGADVILRIEDHDRIRSRPEFEAALLEDVEWLGFVSRGLKASGYQKSGYRGADLLSSTGRKGSLPGCLAVRSRPSFCTIRSC